MQAQALLRTWIALALWSCVYPVSTLAQTVFERIRYSPDAPVAFAGTTVALNNVADDDLNGSVVLVDAGAIPTTANVTGYHQEGANQLLSFDTAVSLPGGLTVRPGDVVRFDGANFSFEFDASGSNIPSGAVTDAVTVIEGDPLLSFDVPVLLNEDTLNELTAGPEDLVRFDQDEFSLFFDGSEANLPVGLNLDAADYLDVNGHVLLSFDGSGSVGGVAFADEDALEYDSTSEAWLLAYDGSQEHAGWHRANLEALSVALPATATPTSTRTATNSATPTIRSTPGVTATGTRPPTATRTRSATSTSSPSFPATPTSSHTAAVTATQPPTATPGVDDTRTATVAAPPTTTPTDTGALTPTQTPVRTASPAATRTSTQATATPSLMGCGGDCDDSRTVTVDELIVGVNAALGSSPVGDCPAFDRDASGTVGIEELLVAVGNALTGCTEQTVRAPNLPRRRIA